MIVNKADNQDTSIEELRGHLLEALSHDLRSPITSIYMWVDIMERKRDDKTLTRGLEVISRSARAQTRMLDEALQLASMMVESPSMERETLDFAELLRSELPALLEARDGEPIALQTEEIGSDFNLAGDATRLRQMISHLMSNVLKVAPSPGLRLIASQAEIEVEISDRGTPAAASRLRPMLEASDTSRGSDTHVRFSVLQIAVAKRVAALHGGSIMASAPDQSNGPAIIRIRLRR